MFVQEWCLFQPLIFFCPFAIPGSVVNVLWQLHYGATSSSFHSSLGSGLRHLAMLCWLRLCILLQILLIRYLFSFLVIFIAYMHTCVVFWMCYVEIDFSFITECRETNSSSHCRRFLLMVWVVQGVVQMQFIRTYLIDPFSFFCLIIVLSSLYLSCLANFYSSFNEQLGTSTTMTVLTLMIFQTSSSRRCCYTVFLEKY